MHCSYVTFLDHVKCKKVIYDISYISIKLNSYKIQPPIQIVELFDEKIVTEKHYQ